MTMATILGWSLTEGLPGFALEVTIKASLLLLFAHAAVALLARGSASVRHFIWFLAVAGALVLPLLSASLPWSWNVLPAPRAVEAVAAAEAAVVDEPLVSDELRVNVSTSDLASMSGMEPTSALATSLTDWAKRQPVSAESAPTASTSTAPATASSPAAASADVSRRFSVSALLPSARALQQTAGLVWITIASLLLLHQLTGILGLMFLSRGAEPVLEHETRRLFTSLVAGLGIRRSVRLCWSPRIAIPMTWGVARPVVLLPESSREWSAERTRLVLQHELAHVHRLDALTLSLGRIACALHWFNPLMWLAVGRMRSESERAADDCVLRQGERASDYAGHLLDIVTQMGAARARAGALPFAEPSRLENRLVAILEPALERGAVRRTTAIAAAAAAVAAVVLLAAVAPAQAAATDNTTPSSTDVGSGEVAGSVGGSTEFSADPTFAAVLPEQQAPQPAVQQAPQPLAQQAPQAAQPSRQIDQTRRQAIEEQLRQLGQQLSQSDLTDRSRRQALEAQLRQIDQQVSQVSLAVRGIDEAVVRQLQAGAAEIRRQLAPQQERDPRAVAALIRALREDQDAEVRRTSAWALGTLDDTTATAALGEALGRETSAEVRQVIAWAMGQIDDPDGVPALVGVLDDADVEVRRTAIWALGAIDSPAAIGPLGRALSDADPEARRSAIYSLGQIGTAEIVGPLSAAVTDADVGVREQAVWALGQARVPAAIAPLTRALSDTSIAVRRHAAAALGTNRSVEAVVEAVPALSEVLRRDPDAEVRQQAAWALGQIDSPAGVPALSAALGDADPEVATLAAYSLGQIAPETPPAELTRAATSGSGELRHTALWALTRMGAAAALPALTAAAADPDPAIRARALNGLAQLRDPGAVEALTVLLRDSDPTVRAAAARALAGQRGPAIADPRPRPAAPAQPRPRPVPRPSGG
jgi:HEAT repeat protein/beta-lactamase regulating signal transducer with metallopeptidase domain